MHCEAVGRRQGHSMKRGTVWKMEGSMEQVGKWKMVEDDAFSE